jgi:predicted tellurium resistance membrane protein TerC
MLRRGLAGHRLIALFALGWLLFNYPLLALFNNTLTWLGIPLLYGYLFTAWAMFIGLLAFTVEQKAPRKGNAQSTPSAPVPRD